MSETNNNAEGYAPGGTPGSKGNGKNKIDGDTAVEEFGRWCEENDIDCDVDVMAEEDRKGFESIKKRFVKACMQGRVTADGTDLKYTVSNFSPLPFGGETVVIKRPDGHAFLGMDGYKETQSIKKIHGFMSALTGKDVAYFSKVDRLDWLFFRDISTLFLVD